MVFMGQLGRRGDAVKGAALREKCVRKRRIQDDIMKRLREATNMREFLQSSKDGPMAMQMTFF